MYKWFMAWRYLYTKLIAIFAILGVTLCVAMVLVVLSVMGGFLDTVKKQSRGLLADIIIDSGTLQGWPLYDEFAEYLETNHSDVVDVTTPVIRNYGIFRVPEIGYTQPTGVIGIRLEEYGQTNDFLNSLHYDRYFPGTTHLGPQQQPFAGSDGGGKIVLPNDHRLANQKWRERMENEGRTEKIKEWNVSGLGRPGNGTIAVFDWNYDSEISGRAIPAYKGNLYDGIIVGSDLINSRREDGSFERVFPRGIQVALTLMPVTQRGNIASEGAIAVALRYADDSATGVFEVDKNSVYVDFDMIQHALAMDPQELIDGGYTKPRTTQLLVNLKEPNKLEEGKKAVVNAWNKFLNGLDYKALNLTADEERMLGWVEVSTWEDMQRQFITALEKEKVLMTVLFGLISVVAVVLIGCIFYMIVQKKTRDIGVLKALGATGEGIAALFVLYGASVGLVGAVLGTTVGATFVWYINDIQNFLISLDPNLRVWSPQVYTFDTIPNVVKVGDATWIAATAIFAAVLGSLIPALLASRVWPVRALRYE